MPIFRNFFSHNVDNTIEGIIYFGIIIPCGDGTSNSGSAFLGGKFRNFLVWRIVYTYEKAEISIEIIYAGSKENVPY